MSLLVELSPKLLLEFKDGEKSCDISCDLRTKNLYKLMKNYNCDFKLLTALGGNFGEEIYNYFMKNSVKVERIDIRDDTGVIGIIRDGKITLSGESSSQVFTFDDIRSIKSKYITSIYNENDIILPIFESEMEFASEFIKKANEYYKNIIIFGPKAHLYIKFNPTIAILTKKEVVELCPFKITSNYEFVNFSYSLVEDFKTRVIIIDDDSLYFYKTGICYLIENIKTDFTKTLFATVFASQNNMDNDAIIQFVAAANIMPSDSRIGDIIERSNKIKVGVYRRWGNSAFCT